jgi:hypothetical protein
MGRGSCAGDYVEDLPLPPRNRDRNVAKRWQSLGRSTTAAVREHGCCHLFLGRAPFRSKGRASPSTIRISTIRRSRWPCLPWPSSSPTALRDVSVDRAAPQHPQPHPQGLPEVAACRGKRGLTLSMLLGLQQLVGVVGQWTGTIRTSRRGARAKPRSRLQPARGAGSREGRREPGTSTQAPDRQRRR